jgi:hypothetical protein
LKGHHVQLSEIAAREINAGEIHQREVIEKFLVAADAFVVIQEVSTPIQDEAIAIDFHCNRVMRGVAVDNGNTCIVDEFVGEAAVLHGNFESPVRPPMDGQDNDVTSPSQASHALGDLRNACVGEIRHRKTYEADKIIRELEKLHPKFYPHAVIQTKQGREEFNAVLRKDGFLTKEELIQVYGRCGNVLHRGSFRGLFLTNRYANLGFAEIKAWKDKIETLLGYHLISMVDNKTFVLFTLHNKLNNNQVQWMSFEKIEDQTWTWEPGVEIRIPASYWPQEHWVGE